MSIVAASVAALITHLEAAGAAVTPTITDVARSDLLIPGSARCIRVAWAGESEPARMGAQRSLNSEIVGERFMIRAFWATPLSPADTIAHANRDADVAALRDEIRTRLLGDSQLGGACTDLEVGYMGGDDPQFIELAGTVYRVLDCPLIVDYSEFTIAA